MAHTFSTKAQRRVGAVLFYGGNMEAFARAIEAAARDMGCRGIGTMGEKSLHLTLKHYYAPDPDTHELPVGGFIADAVTEHGVVEIQTRGLSRLKPKLDAFLPCCPVTVVHPVIAEKQVIRVDENGEIISQRKSPVHETVFSKMREIYTLRDYFARENFRLLLPVLSINEYSVPVRKGKYKKLDRDPTALHGEILLDTPADFTALLPEACPETVTAGELAALLRADANNIRMLLNLFGRLGLAETVGRGREGQRWKIVSGVIGR